MRLPVFAGIAALLAGCAGTPLPPWESSAKPASHAQSSAPAEPASPILSSSPTGQSQQQPYLPYAQAIADKFPEPRIRYQTPGLETGREKFTTNEEIQTWLQDLATKSLGQLVRLGIVNAGMSQNGRPVYAFVATKTDGINPDALDSTGRPTVLVVAGQSAADAAPTEALLSIAKELGQGGLLQSMLDKVNVLLVPRANPDDFEARPAATADRNPLFTDHLALTTPEARALAKLMRDYRPAVVISAQEFAAIEPFRQHFKALAAYDAGLQLGVGPNVHEFTLKAEREWLQRPVSTQMANAGINVDWGYEASARDKTLSMGSITPTNLHNVAALKNAPSIMVQSRGADLNQLHIQRRVHTVVTAITSAMQDTGARANELKKVNSFVTRDIASQSCRGSLNIAAQPARSQREIRMLDAETGETRNIHTEVLSSTEQRSTQQRPRPCGYWLAASNDRAVERLRLHGVQVQRVAESASVQAETYTPTSDGKVQLQRTSVTPEPGSFYVSMNQPLANVAAAALEPDTPFSYVSSRLIPSIGDVARVTAPTSLVFEEE